MIARLRSFLLAFATCLSLLAAAPPAPAQVPASGTVMAWGNNGYGQTTVPAGLSGVTAIAAGDLHTVALKNDGTVVAWGYNNDGQTTVPAGLRGVTAIAAGYFHTVALKNDGTLVAWGNNVYRQRTVPAGLSGVTAIAAGFWHTVALKNDGTVVAWGGNEFGETTIPLGLSGVTSIAARVRHTVALKNDGTVVAWGNNGNGQTTIPVGLSGVTAIAAGSAHTLAMGNSRLFIAPALTLSTRNLPANAATLTITGRKFDAATPGNNTVVFNNGAVGTVTAATPTELTVTFSTKPASAGPLTAIVTTEDGSSVAVQVATVIPELTGSTAALSVTATALTLNGFGFSTTPGNNTVAFTPAGSGTVTAATATTLTVTNLRGLMPGALQAVVTTNGQNSGPPVQVAMVIPPPTVNPDQAKIPFNTIALTITGMDFDAATPGNNTVAFTPGGSGTVTAATATSLTVTGLSGLSLGALNAVVTTNGQNSGAAVQVATVTVPAGSLGTDFNAAISGGGGYVLAMAVLPEGKLVIGGSFTTVGGAAHQNIARLNPDGSVDANFTASANDVVWSVAVQADGKLVLGGDFTSVNGSAVSTTTGVNRIARLQADGTQDTSFNASGGTGLGGVNGVVSSVAVQADGKLVLGGDFTSVNGSAVNRIVRLQADGSQDTSFTASGGGVNGFVRCVAVQADGKLVLGGDFTSVNGSTVSTATGVNRITRLQADGTLDAAFNASGGVGLGGANGVVNSVAVQPDGKLVLGGNFTNVNGSAVNRIVRLNADGTRDPSFVVNLGGANGVVNSVAVQADGKLVLGGNFTRVNGSTLSTTTGVNRIVRLLADGTRDSSFNASSVTGLGGANDSVTGVAVQADGRVLLGGYFTGVNGTARSALARLSNDDATQSLTAPDRRLLLWSRLGAGPEFSSVTFEQSRDSGTTWTMLGAGTRVGNTPNWQLGGISLPKSFSVRARGRTISGFYGGSSGLIEEVAAFNDVPAPRTVLAWGWNGNGQTTVPAELSGVVAIAAGVSHSIALKKDGTVVAWGQNDYGEAAVPAGLSGVTAIAAGYRHNVALKNDGTVVAWGYNGSGQTTVPAGLSGVTAIAAGYFHTLAVKNDGTVVAWGNNEYGQTTIPVGLSGVAAIAGGWYHTVALKKDGTVVAWGNNGNGQTTIPVGLSGVTAIAAGSAHTLALKNDGTVVAWGYNGSGQTTVPAGLSGVTAIAAGDLHTVALKNDGTVVAWGHNGEGQTDVAVGLSGVAAIAVGSFHNVALGNSGLFIAPALNLNTGNLPANAATMTITGRNFYTTTPGNTVVFSNGAAGAVTAATATKLTVTFSTRATSAGPLTAVVTTEDGSSVAVQVATVIPELTGSTAALSVTATALTLNGFGFLTTPGNNTVVFTPSGSGTVTAATATTLTVTNIRGLTLGPLHAVVTSNGYTSGAAVAVATVKIPRPTVNTDAGLLFSDATTLTITGSGFDALIPENNTVIFTPGGRGIVTDSTTTELTVTSLSGLTPGPLLAVVTNDGQDSIAAVQVATVLPPPPPTVTPGLENLPVNATTLTITGTNFDAVTPGNNTVVFTPSGSGTVTAATATSLTVTGLSGLSAGTLNAVVTTNTVSSGAPVAVATVLVRPVISQQPTADSLIVTGATLPLSVTATGSALTYQWYQGTSGSILNPVFGATSPSFTTPPLATTTSYWVRVSNVVGNADSSAANVVLNTRLTVQPATGGTVTGAGLFAQGLTANLNAAPEPGYVFTGWTGDISGTTNPRPILMNTDKTIGAAFGPDPSDADGDGLSAYLEQVVYGTSPSVADTDADGLTDGWEVGSGRFSIVEGSFSWTQARTDAKAKGGDLASFPDENRWNRAFEALGTSALDRFTGLWIGASDATTEGTWTWVNGATFAFQRWAATRPSTIASKTLNFAEVAGGEGAEIGRWYDRTSATIRDGYLLEVGHATSPTNADTDADGLSDGAEANSTATNPLVKDTNGDGVSDAEEDFDGDGFTNWQEVELFLTAPNNASDRFAVEFDYTRSAHSLAFPTVSGRTYRVERSLGLSGPSVWVEAVSFIGNGAPVIVPLGTPFSSRWFYRVRVGLN